MKKTAQLLWHDATLAKSAKQKIRLLVFLLFIFATACSNEAKDQQDRVVDLTESSAQPAPVKQDLQQAADKDAASEKKLPAQAATDQTAPAAKSTAAQTPVQQTPAALRIVSVKGKGKLSRANINKTLQKNAASLESCHAKQARLTLKIDQRGKVQYVKARNKVERKSLRCLNSRIRRWRFSRVKLGVIYLTIEIQ